MIKPQLIALDSCQMIAHDLSVKSHNDWRKFLLFSGLSTPGRCQISVI